MVRKASDPSPVLPAAPPARPLRVLLAEDAPANRVLSMHVLQRRGHAVADAVNGEQAVALARAQDFDVVLMDVQMPVLDGLQATAAIRALADRKKAGVPIVALTAHALKGDLDRCLEAGMDAYLSKPFHAAELIEIVERMADHAPAVEPAREAAPDERPRRPAPPAEPASGAVFNLAEGVARSLGKYDLFRQMAGFFFQDADPMLEKMRAALAEGNAEEFTYVAHRFKGTIVYLGSRPTAECIERVERIGRSGDLAPAAEAIDDLQRWIQLLKSALAPHRADWDEG